MSPERPSFQNRSLCRVPSGNVDSESGLSINGKKCNKTDLSNDKLADRAMVILLAQQRANCIVLKCYAPGSVEFCDVDQEGNDTQVGSHVPGDDFAKALAI